MRCGTLVMAGIYACTRCLAEPYAFFGIVEQSRRGSGEGGGIADRCQHAGDAIGNDRGDAAGAAGDDGQACRLGFEEGHAIGFVDRGPQVKIGRGICRGQFGVARRRQSARVRRPACR